MSNLENKIEMLNDFIKEVSDIDPWLLEMMTHVLERQKQLKNKYRPFNDIEPSVVSPVIVPDSTSIPSPKEEETPKEEEKTDLTPTPIPDVSSFTNFIQKIDDYINSFNYDDLMIKESFFLNMPDAPIQEYITNVTPILQIIDNSGADITSTNSLLTMAKKDSGTQDEFTQKKRLYDENTTFISKTEIFRDDKQELIFKFQYLVNKFFNTMVDKYKKHHSLNDDDIYFVYKGGTFMKILYEKYNTLFTKNENFFNKFKDCFARSDSDYAIFINNRFDKPVYTFHYYNLNIMTYNILMKISTFIDRNLTDILPINQISTETLKKHLEHINNFFNVNKDTMTYFKDIEKFIGINIANNNFFDEKFNINSNNDIYKLKSSNMSDVSDIVLISGAKTTKDTIFVKKKKAPIERHNFFMSPYKYQDNVYFPAIKSINGVALKSGIYNYLNETNRFQSKLSSALNYFCLHRVKINIILYFKTHDGKYGFFQCPSELIDIPISTFDDYKKDIEFAKILKSHEKTLNSKKLTFNTYSIYGLIDDIKKALFTEEIFPWGDNKYTKKINRICFFFAIYLNNKYKNVSDILDKFKTFLIKLDESDKPKFINKNGIEQSDDDIYNMLTKNLKMVEERATTDINKKLFLDMNELLRENINLFNPEDINSGYDNSPEDVPYLQKYLKYKQKYLSLKKNI